MISVCRSVKDQRSPVAISAAALAYTYDLTAPILAEQARLRQIQAIADEAMHNFLLRYYVAEHGLDPDQDIQIRVVPPPGAFLQATPHSERVLTEAMVEAGIREGLPRHASTHAAGVVISDRPLVDYLPLYRGKKGEVVTQYDMKIVEKIGLVKFDFLGLRNLTVIEKTLALIKRQGKIPPDLAVLDLDDPDTYRLLSAGDTTGVFQLESSGMKDLLVRLKPEGFNDIIALVALYRPGTMESGMIDDYVDRKHGRKQVEYLLPQLAPILEETYGVIVYQEQVMQIAQELAGYSLVRFLDEPAGCFEVHRLVQEIVARYARNAKPTGAQSVRGSENTDGRPASALLSSPSST